MANSAVFIKRTRFYVWVEFLSGFCFFCVAGLAFFVGNLWDSIACFFLAIIYWLVAWKMNKMIKSFEFTERIIKQCKAEKKLFDRLMNNQIDRNIG